MRLLLAIFQFLFGKRRLWCVNCQMECLGKRIINDTPVSWCARCDAWRPVEVTIGI